MKQELEMHEHVRLIYKHLKWASEHAAKIYNLIKPEDKNEIIPDNQMVLFDEEGESSKE